MRIRPTRVQGIWELIPEPINDERGSFARILDVDQLDLEAIAFELHQANVSSNARAGTLRGMHYQAAPHGEIKVVRCTRGAVFDVGVDLDPTSPTYREWHAAELTPENGMALLLGPCIAHGFQTLVDDSDVHYLMGAPYIAEAQRGVRWNDPAFGIAWPEPASQRIISERDQALPLMTD